MELTGQTTRASEQGHWYRPLPNGGAEPVYEVMGAKGMVKPDIRHARKLGLYPGCTTIIKCAAAPGLVRWQVEQGIMSALTLPRTGKETHDELLAMIREDAEAQARKAREDGTKGHAAIQGHFEGTPPDEEWWPMVQGVLECLRQNFGEQKWIAEKPVSHPLGFGTKSDLHCPSVATLDFKGVDGDKAALARLKTWESHHMQLAATGKALAEERGAHGIIYFSRTHPGECRLVLVDQSDLDDGWEMFCGLHRFWSAKNRYWPGSATQGNHYQQPERTLH